MTESRPAERSRLANDDPVLRRYWHPACREAELAAGPVGVTVLGEELVLVALSDGTVSALPDRCPHRWGRLSDGCVRDDELQCPYHGWRFDSFGRCTTIPALGAGAPIPPRAHLDPVRTATAMGLVWVALEEPLAPLLDVPEWGAPGIVAVWLPDTTIGSGAAQFIDNFLDIAHFPFVHAGTFGVGEEEGLDDMVVQADPDGAGLRVPYRHRVANPEDPLVATGEHPLVQYRRMEYAWRMPFSARLRLDYELTGVENTVVVTLAPIDAMTSRLFCVLLRNDVDSASDPRAVDAAEFEYRVLTEDLSILERLAERDFGLDVLQQVHTRADRTTIELRRLLAAQLHAADDVTSPAPAPSPVH